MKYIIKHKSLMELESVVAGYEIPTGFPMSITIEEVTVQGGTVLSGEFTFSEDMYDYYYVQGEYFILFSNPVETGTNTVTICITGPAGYPEDVYTGDINVTEVKYQGEDMPEYIEPWVSYLPSGDVMSVVVGYSSWTMKLDYAGEDVYHGYPCYRWVSGGSNYYTGRRNPFLRDYYRTESGGGDVAGILRILRTGGEPRVEYNKNWIRFKFYYQGGWKAEVVDHSENFDNSPASYYIALNANGDVDPERSTNFGPLFLTARNGWVYHIDEPTRLSETYWKFKKEGERWIAEEEGEG